MSIHTQTAAAPPVHIIEADYERLLNLAETHETHGAAVLAAELDRAIVVADDVAAPAFARLYSTVEFQDLRTGQPRVVVLTPPDEADIDAGRLSVVTPVGAALIGLAAGDAFDLVTENGRTQRLVVLSVAPPAA